MKIESREDGSRNSSLPTGIPLTSHIPAFQIPNRIQAKSEISFFDFVCGASKLGSCCQFLLPGNTEIGDICRARVLPDCCELNLDLHGAYAGHFFDCPLYSILYYSYYRYSIGLLTHHRYFPVRIKSNDNISEYSFFILVEFNSYSLANIPLSRTRKRNYILKVIPLKNLI